MTLSTQLRLIILTAGVLLLLVIYLLGRRRGDSETDSALPDESVTRKPKAFRDVVPPTIDDDEYDEPSYLRRGARRERGDTVTVHDGDDESLPLPSVFVDPPVHEVPADVAKNVSAGSSPATTRIPVFSMPDPDKTIPMKVDVVLPSASNVAVVNQSIVTPQPVKSPEQRQLIALRLAMSERVSGEQLLAMFEAESLQHGKFNIFHRLHNGDTVFSVASMLEPGSFDLVTMPSQYYPGVTLFMLLPGPMTGADAFEHMMSCAQRLAQLTSGVVQDEGGVLLLDSGIQRLREKVIDFERSLQA